jgi:hypothetical protein
MTKKIEAIKVSHPGEPFRGTKPSGIYRAGELPNRPAVRSREEPKQIKFSQIQESEDEILDNEATKFSQIQDSEDETLEDEGDEPHTFIYHSQTDEANYAVEPADDILDGQTVSRLQILNRQVVEWIKTNTGTEETLVTPYGRRVAHECYPWIIQTLRNHPAGLFDIAYGEEDFSENSREDDDMDGHERKEKRGDIQTEYTRKLNGYLVKSCPFYSTFPESLLLIVQDKGENIQLFELLHAVMFSLNPKLGDAYSRASKGDGYLDADDLLQVTSCLDADTLLS